MNDPGYGTETGFAAAIAAADRRRKGGALGVATLVAVVVAGGVLAGPHGGSAGLDQVTATIPAATATPGGGTPSSTSPPRAPSTARVTDGPRPSVRLPSQPRAGQPAPTNLPGTPAWPYGPMSRAAADGPAPDCSVVSSGWCLGAADPVRRTDGTWSLAALACPGATSPKDPLAFATDVEADVVVTGSTGVVWRWSDGVRARPGSHTVAAGSPKCWSWSTTWPGVDGAGRPVPSGRYQVTVRLDTTTAVAHQGASATFDVTR